MTELQTACLSAGFVVAPRRRGPAERLAAWILARADRREAEELERLGWDLEAAAERRRAVRSGREPAPFAPPGVGLR